MPAQARAPSATPRDPDPARLADALRRSIQGEVRFDMGSRGLYATDASNYREVPIGVVIPRTRDDVVTTVAACREHGVPILSRGGGTSLAGQTCNEAVVIDWSKYLNRILAIDPEQRIAVVEPGVVLDDLRAAAGEHGLTFGPDPATHSRNSLGGMIGNNSCGVHSVMAGRTADNVQALEVLTYDGLELTVGPTGEGELDAIIRAGGRRGAIYAGMKEIRDRHADRIRRCYPDIPRRVSGYNLNELLPERGFNVARALVGSEGTCVTVLAAHLRLVPDPPFRRLAVLGFRDVYAAADAVPRVLAQGPVGLEGIDERLVDYMRRRNLHPGALGRLPDGGGWLLAEMGGRTAEEAQARARAVIEDLRGSDTLVDACVPGTHEAQAIWDVRESGLAATAHVPGMPDAWPGWEDAAVDPARAGDYLRDFRKLLQRFGYQGSVYGHFGDGCIHVRIDFDLQTQPGVEKYRRFVSEAADLVLAYGGSLSGEHGDGQARAELLPKMFGPELIDAFRRFKALWDPDWRMNPGKVIDADPIDAHLRLGGKFRPPRPETWFSYPEDKGDFVQAAALRCVGVGACRRHGGGVMCPSFMATREEMHSTRGRARMLYEMLGGVEAARGWRSDAVHEALDLCLACKGCKSDCPVNVDMATYKAEFFAHYYAGRLHPREHYAFGHIHRWLRLGSHLPRTLNALAHAPLLGPLAKRAVRMHPDRQIPRLAGRTFTRWFRRRRAAAPDGRREVILWPDTFNNYLRPDTLAAGVRVLERAGWRVRIPDRPLCCGRPLYDYGFIGTAKGLLEEIMASLTPLLREGIPLVGLEPACMATFRDELVNLFPDDKRAHLLAANSLLLSELMEREKIDPPPLARRAVAHVHCNHHAIFGTGAEKAMLAATGLDFELLDAGCCGMAGAFGFEEQHYDVAMKCGERVLLPAVRDADPATLVIADGYSCREQIRQSTGRDALHLAQVWHMAAEGEIAAEYPERGWLSLDRY